MYGDFSLVSGHLLSRCIAWN